MDTLRFRKLLVSGGQPVLPRRSSPTSTTRRPWVLLGYLAIVFLIGGSSRFDLKTLVVLRPLAVMVTAYAMATLPGWAWRANWKIILFAAGVVLLPAAQLIPLPPGLWQSLSGRDIITTIDRAAGIEGAWRPLSMSPPGTLNALFSLAVPLAVLFLGLRLDVQQRRHLVPFVLAIIVGSAVLGVLQIIGPRGGPLYLYEITHPDSPVGFLANRNHQAAFVACAFPILGYLASDAEFSQKFFGRPAFALVATVFLLPFLLIVGSRAGLVVGCGALVLATILYLTGLRDRSIAVDRKVLATVGGGIVVVVVMTALAIGLDRAEAFRRAVGWESDSDFRLRAWSEIVRFGQDYWPWGTGMGSFVELYKIYEPHAMLQPAYFNQAHNDWLEVLLTGGIAGAILLVLAVVSWALRAWHLTLPKAGHELARLGLAVALLFATASITDYPLRVPSLAAIFVIAVIWALPAKSEPGARTQRTGV